jgi:CcmD family protein
MPVMDHNAIYVIWAFGITWVTLGGYLLYLRSRLRALRSRARAPRDADHSERNVAAAAARPTTAQAASSVNGPRTP